MRCEILANQWVNRWHCNESSATVWNILKSVAFTINYVHEYTLVRQETYIMYSQFILLIVLCKTKVTGVFVIIIVDVKICNILLMASGWCKIFCPPVIKHICDLSLKWRPLDLCRLHNKFQICDVCWCIVSSCHLTANTLQPGTDPWS